MKILQILSFILLLVALILMVRINTSGVTVVCESGEEPHEPADVAFDY